MTNGFWDQLSLDQQRGARYRKLAAAIEQGIDEGDLEPGRKLPPQRDLAFDLGVTVGTVGRAYDLLVRKGQLRGQVGRGTFVCDKADRLVPTIGHIEDGGDGLNLTVNTPIQTEAMAAIADIMASVANSETGRATICDYPPTQGMWSARQAAAQWLQSQNLDVPTERVLLAGGAQAALASALSGIANAGDGILLESLAYTRFATLAKCLGMRPEGIAMDDQGMRADALDAACRQGRGRVVLLSPTMQNPTGCTMGEDRRMELAKVAKAHDLIIIEDDVYGILTEQEYPKLQTLLPERTIYITSLSKFLAPGLRMGMMALPEKFLHKITANHGNFSIASPALMGLCFIQAQQQGLLPIAAKQQIAAIKQRQSIAREPLKALNIKSPPTSLHLWVELPDTRQVDTVIIHLAGQGIKVANGRFFANDAKNDTPFIRISLGPFKEATLASDLSAIAQAFNKAPANSLAI